MIIPRCAKCGRWHRAVVDCDAYLREADARMRDMAERGAPSAIRTDDNNPLKNSKRCWGVDFSTRQAIKDREAEGIVVANERDDECARRVHKTAPTEMLQEELRREEQRLSVSI